MSNKLSIIVPIYNKEKYLNKSLVSLKEQTYKNIEVILIDDGSIDNSKEICMKFCTEDNRFKYYYKKNGGVASARNLGLEKATGDFIGFVDPDDYIEYCMYEIMMEEAKTNSLDIVGCGINIIQNNKIEKITAPNDFQLHPNDAISHLLKWDNVVTPYLWNKIFRRSILKNIKFNELLKVGEDIPFIFEAIINSSEYVHLHNYLYNYVKNEDSLVGTNYKKESSINSIQSSLYICQLSDDSYKKYKEICQYSLLLNAYFQMNIILRQRKSNNLWNDFNYFRDIAIKIDKKCIKKYGSKLLKFKIDLCLKYPNVYKLGLKLKR